jgi:hypothetical protein
MTVPALSSFLSILSMDACKMHPLCCLLHEHIVAHATADCTDSKYKSKPFKTGYMNHHHLLFFRSFNLAT